MISGVNRSSVSSLLRLPPGGPVDLAAHDPAATPGFSGGRKRAREEVAALAEPLVELQTRLYAQSTAGATGRVLLAVQGRDCSGKDGVAKNVVGLLNPMWLRYAAFVRPTPEELRHDFLWRIRKQVPLPGQITMFNRSHYEDVLVVRVHNLVPQRTWLRRYGVINRFEQELTESGVRLIKVMLHVSPEEQLERLRARLEDPTKYWKYNPNDLDERAFRAAYDEAYEAALTRCSTEAAPWHVVPADHKWYRDWAVAHLLLENLEQVDPSYPPPAFDLAAERARPSQEVQSSEHRAK